MARKFNGLEDGDKSKAEIPYYEPSLLSAVFPHHLHYLALFSTSPPCWPTHYPAFEFTVFIINTMELKYWDICHWKASHHNSVTY